MADPNLNPQFYSLTDILPFQVDAVPMPVPGAAAPVAPTTYDTAQFEPVAAAPQEIGTQTYIERTPELQAAAQNAQAALDSQAASIGTTLPEQAAIAEQQSALIEQKANVMGQAEQARQASAVRFDSEYAKVKEEIAARQQELEAANPKTFWAKADTADKIGVALALMVGGAAAGTGPNMAQKALNDAIDRDWTQQQANLDRKMKLLEAKKVDAKDILSARMLAEQDLAAHQLASLGQLDAQLASLEPKIRTAQQKEAIMRARAELGQDKAALQLQIEQSLAPKIERKLMSQEALAAAPKGVINSGESPQRQAELASAFAAMKPSKGWGEVGKLSDLQGKSAGMLIKHDKSLAEIESIEKALTPEQRFKLGEALRSTLTAQQAQTIPVIGRGIEAFNTFTGQSPAEKFEKAVPGIGGKYFKLIDNFAKDQLRYESGAAISQEELATAFGRYALPVDANPEAQNQTVQDRRDLMKAHRSILGQRNKPLFFESQGQ